MGPGIQRDRSGRADVDVVPSDDGVAARLRTHLIARINADIVKALMTPELKEKLFVVGAEAVGSSPDRLARFLQSETARWDKVLRAGGTIPGKKAEG